MQSCSTCQIWLHSLFFNYYSTDKCDDKWIDIWSDREFRVHSDYTLTFVTTCLHIENKFEKVNEKYISGESDESGCI